MRGKEVGKEGMKKMGEGKIIIQGKKKYKGNKDVKEGVIREGQEKELGK